ncbi:hypothetical protein [Yersinia phage MHG19]|nr:hypothetical protein [Yersinia phage MHG19]
MFQVNSYYRFKNLNAYQGFVYISAANKEIADLLTTRVDDSVRFEIFKVVEVDSAGDITVVSYNKGDGDRVITRASDLGYGCFTIKGEEVYFEKVPFIEERHEIDTKGVKLRISEIHKEISELNAELSNLYKDLSNS